MSHRACFSPFVFSIFHFHCVLYYSCCTVALPSTAQSVTKKRAHHPSVVFFPFRFFYFSFSVFSLLQLLHRCAPLDCTVGLHHPTPPTFGETPVVFFKTAFRRKAFCCPFSLRVLFSCALAFLVPLPGFARYTGATYRGTRIFRCSAHLESSSDITMCIIGGKSNSGMQGGVN